MILGREGIAPSPKRLHEQLLPIGSELKVIHAHGRERNVATIRVYEGPDFDDGLVGDFEVEEVPRVGENIRTTLMLSSGACVLHRARYVIRGVEHDFHGSNAGGPLAWDMPVIWVLVEAIAAS